MATSNTTELRVSDMTCNNCARTVTEAIQSATGVDSATVSLANKTATVRWKGRETNVPAVLAAIAQSGFKAVEFDPTEGGDADSKPDRWQWNLILGVAVTVFLMTGDWGFGLMLQPWFQWLAFALAGMVQIFAGAPFYRGAWNQLKAGYSNMDTLVALGSTTAFGYSAWALLSGRGGHLYFMEAAAIISLISLGHWLEAQVSDQASGTLRALLSLAPPMARRIRNPEAEKQRQEGAVFNLRALTFSQASKVSPAVEEEVPVAELEIGDRIVLRAGEHVPVDGTVMEGNSSVNESMLTGESLPAEKKSASTVFAGTLNLNGRMVVRVTATGETTALAKIIAAVQRAQTSRAEIQRLGDRISGVFVPVVVAIALLAGLGWGLAPQSMLQVHEFLGRFLWHSHLPAGAAAGFIIAAGVLIVACPCAMGLATPAAIMASANAAARRGILIRDGIALEKAGQITAVIFDKTGTLTSGGLAVAGPWTPTESESAKESAQKIASALARQSNHPVSKVLACFPPEILELKNCREIAGSGVQAEVLVENGQRQILRLGSLAWLRACEINIPENEPQIEKWQSEGASVVGVARANRLLGIFALRDFLKPGAAKVVGQLQSQKLKTFLLTGDNQQAALAMAREIGIPPENVFAQVRPTEKADFVKRLQARGERVAFVGDGINDAPALSQADLGIAVCRASDIAREAADIILLKSEIEAVPECLGLARATLRTIRQNLFWAFLYNALGVPLAALGFISPVFCAAAMGCSDLIVIGNALRLLRWSTPRLRQ